MKGYDQIKEYRSLSPWGRMVPILKMRRFSTFREFYLDILTAQKEKGQPFEIDNFSFNKNLFKNLVNILDIFNFNSECVLFTQNNIFVVG